MEHNPICSILNYILIGLLMKAGNSETLPIADSFCEAAGQLLLNWERL